MGSAIQSASHHYRSIFVFRWWERPACCGSRESKHKELCVLLSSLKGQCFGRLFNGKSLQTLQITPQQTDYGWIDYIVLIISLKVKYIDIAHFRKQSKPGLKDCLWCEAPLFHIPSVPLFACAYDQTSVDLKYFNIKLVELTVDRKPACIHMWVHAVWYAVVILEVHWSTLVCLLPKKNNTLPKYITLTLNRCSYN